MQADGKVGGRTRAVKRRKPESTSFLNAATNPEEGELDEINQKRRGMDEYRRRSELYANVRQEVGNKSARRG